jgi:hypothetical protein
MVLVHVLIFFVFGVNLSCAIIADFLRPHALARRRQLVVCYKVTYKASVTVDPSRPIP